MKKSWLWLIGLSILLLFSFSLYYFLGAPSTGEAGDIRIGHTNSPLLAALYIAADEDSFRSNGIRVKMEKFGTTGEIGYALLSQKVNVGFLETGKSLSLLNVPGGQEIRIAGAVIFPYGAALVVRQDLDIRLDDLVGLKVAAEDEDCQLLRQFKSDAERWGVDVSKINFVYMSFDLMLPALEAGKVDAAIFKMAHALLAELEGHKTLYQNWEVKTDDLCCPQYLAHVEYFMLVNGLDAKSLNRLSEALEVSNKVSSDDSSRIISKHTGLPERYLHGFPVAEFLPASKFDEGLKEELGGWLWRE